ncbi:MAG: O-antigen ligase family protein [Desulfurella sp.]|jgi:O-antigen ligase
MQKNFFIKCSFFKNLELPSLDYFSKKFILVSAILLTIGLTNSIAITYIALTIGFVGLLTAAASKTFKFKRNDLPIGLLFIQNLLSVFGIDIKNSFTNLNPIRLFLPYFILSRLSEKHKAIVNLLSLVTIFTSICIFINAFFGHQIIDLFSQHIHFYFPPLKATSLWSTSAQATGSIIMMLALVFITLSFYYKSFIYYISALFSFLSLFLIQERSAILGFFIGVMLIPIFLKKFKKKHFVFYYSAVVLVFVIMLQVNFVKKNINQAIKYSSNTSILLRFAQWDAALKAMPKQDLKTILFGFGLNNADKSILPYKISSFKSICDKYSLNCSPYTKLNGTGYMDSLYFQTLIDYGIIGELLLFASIFIILKNNLTAKPISKFSTAFNKATTVAFVSFLVSSLFFSAFLYIDFVYFLMYLLGLNESIKIWDSSDIINKLKYM